MDVRKNVLESVVRQWHSLPREVVESVFVELFNM